MEQLQEDTKEAREEALKAEKQADKQQKRLKELAPAVKNIERLAADFSADPEEILPEPGTLETGRAYRKKARSPAGSNRQGAALPVSGLCGAAGEI